MKTTRLFTICLLTSMIVAGFAVIEASSQAQSSVLPAKDEVTEVMRKVNNYWMNTFSEPGDNKWKRAVYFTGDVAHYDMTGDSLYLDFAWDWAEHNEWQLNDGCETAHADNQCAGQTYIALAEVDVDHRADLSCITTSINNSMTWAWIEVDLGAVHTINRVRVHPDEDRAYRYFVEVKTASDAPYTAVVSDRWDNTEAGSVIEDTFPATEARYIRLRVIGVYGYSERLYTGEKVGIRQFEVFSSEPPSDSNLALDQQVTCSSEPQAENGCANVVDGDFNTHWETDNLDINGWPKNWWWVDAMYMAMPTYAMLGAKYTNPEYYQAMYVRYNDAKEQRGLYDANRGLWYRDENYHYPVIWSRGNGWVFAAHARVLEILPPGAPYRCEYLDTFRAMAAALKAVQDPEGFWNVNLADPDDHPGEETSGTAFFTYGMAWGINNGYLKRSEYEETVAKAWNWMVHNAVQEDGKLGYVQGTAQAPGEVMLEDTADYGVGAFLLAGGQVYEMATSNLALDRPVTCSSEPQSENGCANAVDGDFDNRWSALAFPQWVEVDLGAVYSVDRVRVHPYQDRAYQYYVEVRTTPEEPYTIVVDLSENTQDGPVIEATFPAVNARYVRLRVVGADGYSGQWVSVREIELFGREPLSDSNLAPDSVIDTPIESVTSITVGDTVSFTGTGSDPEDCGSNLTYLWQFGTGSGISDSTAEDPGPVQFNQFGVFTVTFTVSDSDGLADPTPAQASIHVTAGTVPDEVIVDNADAQFSKVGTWKISDKAAGFYGTDYAYALSGIGSSVATFTIQIPTTGNYEISAQWPAHYSRASNAPFELINNGSAVDTIRVDQRVNGGQFNPLAGPVSAGAGVYMLNAGVLQVTLSNDADGKVAADAVRVTSMSQ
jgi:rhamnogalacturonyl hydrolase YesR